MHDAKHVKSKPSSCFFFSYGTNLTKEQSLCISSFREQTPNGSNLTIKGKPTGQKVLCFLFQSWRMIWRKSLQNPGCFQLSTRHVWELASKAKLLTKGMKLHQMISSTSTSLESKAPLLERAFHIPVIWKLDRISALVNSIEFLG